MNSQESVSSFESSPAIVVAVSSRESSNEIAKAIEADSLGYLSIEGVSKILPGRCSGYCDGCFTGKYPMDVSDVDHEIELDGKYRNIKYEPTL